MVTVHLQFMITPLQILYQIIMILYYDAYQNNCLVKIKIIGTTQYNSLADWQATEMI